MYTTTLEDVKEKDNAELKDRLCETYMVLGEVGHLGFWSAVRSTFLPQISLENENYPQAVEDLQICLKQRTDSLSSDSR